ncbi:hypothetical protein SAMN02910265_02858 [Ruminococcus flavefaciens]|uniref:Tetratricopeptide repeat-containing protein n=1 Tax=Ruminococcus flavefaciens TaxID=1265 RepID=A0A1H6LAP2_RUMFL|nr:hypothetical protein [Ruminococcus flavefaciens]SEH81642.1 hypothetical protein SAMN02910265_02858 [Ruminococcus flavefaciens]
MKEPSPKTNKYILIFTSLFMRWAIMFIIIFSLTSLIDIISGQRSNTIAFRVMFAAVGSVIANLIARLFILPRLNKQYSVFRKILQKIADCGYSDDVISKMEEQLTFCRAEPRKYTAYTNQYAMFLAEAYMSLRQFDKAEEKLEIADIDFMQLQAKNPESLPAQHNIVMLCVLWVQLYAGRNDKKMLEDQLRNSERYFAKYRGMNEITDYFMDTAYFESLMIHEQYENALKLLDKYAKDEQLSFGVFLDKARCLKKMGRHEDANSYFDKAYETATNDWRRKTVELERGV